jgi:hypothetical protein
MSTLEKFLAELDKISGTAQNSIVPDFLAGPGQVALESAPAPPDSSSFGAAPAPAPEAPLGRNTTSVRTGARELERSLLQSAEKTETGVSLSSSSACGEPSSRDEVAQALRALVERLRLSGTLSEPPDNGILKTRTASIAPTQREQVSPGDSAGAASSAPAYIASNEAGTCPNDATTTEQDALALQLAAVQHQATLLHRECAWVQRLCDDLSRELSEERQRRLVAEERARQLAEQLEELYDESVRQARSLRLQFEDALEQERETIRTLEAELADHRRLAENVGDTGERLDHTRTQPSSRTSTGVDASSVAAPEKTTVIVAEKLCQTEPVWKMDAACMTDEAQAELAGKAMVVDRPPLKEAYYRTLLSERSEAENPAQEDGQSLRQANLYVELYEALKQRDLWMREAQALARSLRFLRQAFHY